MRIEMYKVLLTYQFSKKITPMKISPDETPWVNIIFFHFSKSNNFSFNKVMKNWQNVFNTSIDGSFFSV